MEDYKYTKVNKIYKKNFCYTFLKQNESIIKKFLLNSDNLKLIDEFKNLKIRLAANCCKRRFIDFYDQIEFIVKNIINKQLESNFILNSYLLVQ